MCIALAMKRERGAFVRATVFTLECQLFHLRNKKEKIRAKKKKSNSEERSWRAMASFGSAYLHWVRNRHIQCGRTTTRGTWPGGWLWTYPQPASLTFTKCYRSISAELAVREHRSSTCSQQVGEQCWKAAKGSDTKRTKRGKPPRTKPQTWKLLQRLRKPKHRFSDFLFGENSLRASRAIAPQ